MKVVNKMRYRMGVGGKFLKELKPELLMEHVVIPESIIKDTNSRTEQRGNGVFYEVDTKSTIAYEKECEKIIEQRKQEAELSKMTAQANLKSILSQSLGIESNVKSKAKNDD